MKIEETRCHRTMLLVRIFWELLRYEVVLALSGFPGIYRGAGGKPEIVGRRDGLENAICAAVNLVCSCYWKRVLCLQRSVVTSRVLNACGIPAEVVIGYGFAPFVSHAWVEVDGRVINDLTGYPAKLQVLDRIRPRAPVAPLVFQA